jgi:hypothetical protein
MTPRDDADFVGRRTPAKGVVLSPDMPLILFCTVCADEKGVTWAAQGRVMRTVEEVWSKIAAAWLVGELVLMPDHMHFFCCPRRISEGVEVESGSSTGRRCSRDEWNRESGGGNEACFIRGFGRMRTTGRNWST